MIEEFKQIKNTHYSISNFGRIRNDRTNKILKAQKNIHGYMVILIYEEGKPKNRQIHRLLLETFKPCENMHKLQVNHIDHNRSNNYIDNLEWVTPSQNCNRKKDRVFYNSKKCFDNFGNCFESFREAGRFYGISANTVKNDCLNKTKRQTKSRNVSFHF